ncbi:MAG: primosomal protein N' [Clostridia bacterium]|nr:primosomal protein N' [Clostridia bacterium]
MAYCEVIVEIAHEQVDRVFTYRVPQGLVLQPGTRVLVPFGPRKVEGYVIRLLSQTDLPEARIKDVLSALEGYPALLPHMMELALWIRDRSHCPLVEALRLMIPAQMRGGRIRERTQAWYALSDGIEDIDACVESQRRAPKRQRILRALQGGPLSGELLAQQVGEPGEALRALCEQGLVERYTEEVLRRPYAEMELRAIQDPPLTEEQQRVLAEIYPALEGGEGRFLLHGVTGSGKTEVYIRAVRRCLQRGKTAIVLVPEIALTPQMVEWFRSRFGQEGAVLHSRLTPGQRFDEWRRVRRGEARVVIGARSAVFAPTEDLGLIIVDEEHETTYLSDRTPRYDAREVAANRCDREEATLILASATPGMGSFARALEGDMTLLEMPNRVLGRPMPSVQLVDMREELRGGNKSIFSGALMEALRDCMRRGEQAMLFINRRGYNTFVKCRECGYVVKCAQCDISMTYHQASQIMRCHYCGAQKEPPQTCPACSGVSIRYFGAGTQMVEEAVKKAFPGIPALRMDNDTTRSRDAHYDLLSRFGKGEARILIGTQMIAKGLDFPNVTLVGVVAADSTLNLPDYRAAERTFQLVTQVAGRAGRAQAPGQVVVQTYEPDHYCIQAASRQDYRAFFAEEMTFRRRLAYPPYAALCRLLIESPDEDTARHTLQALQGQMEAFFHRHPGLRGQVLMEEATEAPVKLIRGKFRYQLFYKLAGKPAEETLQKLSELSRIDWQRAQVYAEVNPVSMM